MAKAYICDRCKDSHEGGPEARVFLESYVLMANGRGSAILAAHSDLCSACTSEIKRVIEQRPPRVAAEL